MDFPTPENVNFLTKLLAWALGLAITGLLSIGIYLLKKFISGQSSTDEKVNSLELSVKTDLKNFSESIALVANSMGATSRQMSTDATEIKQANIDFQQSVAQDLINIKKETIEIETSIGRMHIKAEELDAKFDRTADKIDDLYKRIELHDKAMAAAANVISNHATALEKSRADMKAVKKKVVELAALKNSTKTAKST